MHILLIEPDTILAKVYTQALTQRGHTVDTASTAQTAIMTADARVPDLVVLEMQLAEHSGAAFLYEFRTYTDWLHVPVLVHSLLPPSKLAQFEACLQELGVATCLYKPQTSLQKLVSMVESQLSPAV